jgi:hypothetical protein
MLDLMLQCGGGAEKAARASTQQAIDPGLKNTCRTWAGMDSLLFLDKNYAGN